MKEKLKKFVVSVLDLENHLPDPEKRFVCHSEGEVFLQNLQFKNFLLQIQNFQANGLFTTHLDKKEVHGKNGYIKIDEHTNFYVTALIFGKDETVDRYIELRHDSHILGFGNVWEMADEGKQIFMFENKKTTGFPLDLVSVIKIPKPNFLVADFYSKNGTWLGYTVGTQKKQGKKVLVKYNYVLSKKMFNKEKNEFVAFSGAKTTEELVHPLLLLKSALKTNQISQKVMDGESAYRSRKMQFCEKGLEETK